MGGWHTGRMMPFDLETTGVDYETARIVQAYAGLVGGGLEAMDVMDVLVNPGVEVPAESTKIHGLTTAHLVEHGDPADAAIHTVADVVASALLEGIALVGHNISFDLTILDRECRRYDLPTLADRTRGRIGPVIDTQVLSKHVDKYRRRVSETQGAQALKTCAQAFRVPWDDDAAHGARFDALTAARVAWRIGSVAAMQHRDRPPAEGREPARFEDLRVTLERLHARQVEWSRAQSLGYADYLRKQAKQARETDEQLDLMQQAERVAAGADGWPVAPLPAGQGALA